MTSEKKRGRRRCISGRLAIFIVLLLLVFFIVFLLSYLGSASLRRLSYWLFDGVSGDGTEATIKFSENENNLFALTDDNFTVVSPNLLSVYELSGSSTLSIPAQLRNPAVSSSESTFLAYDLGGLNFYVADESDVLFSGTTDAKILNANLNNSGYFAIVTDSNDCKSLVSVYDSDFEVIYKFHSSEQYVLDAVVSPDCDIIAIITYGTAEGKFTTSLSLCKTSESAFFATYSFRESMPLKISYLSDNQISVICDDRLLFFDGSGNLTSEFYYDSMTLQAFSIAYDNHVALLLQESNSAEMTRLVCLDGSGNVREAIFNEAVYSLSSAGEYTSVLFIDRCTVYDEDLSTHCSISTTPVISDCLVNDDGSLLLIDNKSAIFYVK